jgi:hypothetical protein
MRVYPLLEDGREIDIVSGLLTEMRLNGRQSEQS